MYAWKREVNACLVHFELGTRPGRRGHLRKGGVEREYTDLPVHYVFAHHRIRLTPP